MLNPHSLELRVGVDVGSQSHHVAVGLSDGRLLDEFEIPHTAAGFREFFSRIEGHAKRHPYPIAVAMEGYTRLIAWTTEANPNLTIRCEKFSVMGVTNLAVKLAITAHLVFVSARKQKAPAPESLPWR